MAVLKHTFEDDGRKYYYIHRHLEHFERDKAIKLFQSQKKQNYLIMKDRFKRNYLDNVNIDERALKILNASMEEDELIGNLDETLLNILNTRVSEAIAQYDLNKKISGAYNSLDKYLKSKDAKDLNELFTQISAATDLLNTDNKELVALIGPRGLYKKNPNLKKLSNLLQKEIQSLENSRLNVSKQRLLSVEKSLNNLVNGLSNKDFNKTSLQKYLSNIFSTQIGEYVVSKAVSEGLNIGLKEIRASLSGTSNIKIDSTEVDDLIQQYGQRGKTTFKTDNSFKDLNIVINDQGNSVNINLGISTKWYNSSKGRINDSVAITTEVSFLHRVNQMITDDLGKYYVYNSLAWVNDDDSMYKALKAAIVARNLDVLVSGIGIQGDFSQFIVINGEFYSIWQIIVALENYNHGEGSYSKNSSMDPVTISATGLSKVAELNEKVKNDPGNLVAAYARSKQQNHLIEELGLSGHFFPNKLKNILT